MLACIAVVLLWMWLRVFVCWDNPFWGASVVCHLEVFAILILVAPLLSLYGLVRPHIRTREPRTEPWLALEKGELEDPSSDSPPRAPQNRLRQFGERIRTRARDNYESLRDDYKSLPEGHRSHVRVALPVLLGALLVLALFLWRVRFNLFWTY